jgi:hypothetical protein
MMALDLSRALDPMLLARDCGIECDEWQATLLRERPRRALLCCSRQSGKSTAVALLGLWTAIFEPPALVLLLSPSLRQSGELFRTCMGFHAKLSGAPTLNMESVLRAEFSNGSRIISLPGGGEGKTIRGYAKASLVVIDEAARCEDELLAAARPMMATSDGGGRLICLSTPCGKRGFFYESWQHGDNWTRVRVAADQCPRITKEFLDEELKELGAQRFSEEYGLEFLDPDEAVFPTAIIDAAFTQEVLPLWR